MYLGQIVEVADTIELFENPAHPYTRTLLSAIPRPDPKKRGKNELFYKGIFQVRLMCRPVADFKHDARMLWKGVNMKCRLVLKKKLQAGFIFQNAIRDLNSLKLDDADTCKDIKPSMKNGMWF